MDKAPLHEDFLKKEEEKKKWVEYWVVLRSAVLYFYDDQTDLWHEYCYKIEITPSAKCSVVRRKVYSYRFKLVTSEGSWLLKCQTNLQRHRWMHSIDVAVRRISFDATDVAPALAMTPRGCYEEGSFGRSVLREIRQREATAISVGKERNNNSSQEKELIFNTEICQGIKCETPKVKESIYGDKQTTIALKAGNGDCVGSSVADIGSPQENLAFSDDEVSIDGRAKRHNTAQAKLICVESAHKLSTSVSD